MTSLGHTVPENSVSQEVADRNCLISIKPEPRRCSTSGWVLGAPKYLLNSRCGPVALADADSPECTVHIIRFVQETRTIIPIWCATQGRKKSCGTWARRSRTPVIMTTAYGLLSYAAYRLYLGIADGMSIAQVWTRRYSKRPPRRGGDFEYWHIHSHAIDMPSATPRLGRSCTVRHRSSFVTSRASTAGYTQSGSMHPARSSTRSKP